MVSHRIKCHAGELVCKMCAWSKDRRIETQTWASIVAILASNHGPPEVKCRLNYHNTKRSCHSNKTPVACEAETTCGYGWSGGVWGSSWLLVDSNLRQVPALRGNVLSLLWFPVLV
jgi:hypothetical protein